MYFPLSLSVSVFYEKWSFVFVLHLACTFRSSHRFLWFIWYFAVICCNHFDELNKTYKKHAQNNIIPNNPVSASERVSRQIELRPLVWLIQNVLATKNQIYANETIVTNALWMKLIEILLNDFILFCLLSRPFLSTLKLYLKTRPLHHQVILFINSAQNRFWPFLTNKFVPLMIEERSIRTKFMPCFRFWTPNISPSLRSITLCSRTIGIYMHQIWNALNYLMQKWLIYR